MRRVGKFLIVFLLSLLLKIWIRTLRVRFFGPPFVAPGLIGFWHGDQLALLRALPCGPCVALVSLSRDGEFQSNLLKRFGISSIRGSSSKGGLSALREALRVLRSDRFLLMALDGPRGPYHRSKPGAVYLAQKSGLPIFPVAVAVRTKKFLQKAWDRFLLPLPFSQVAIWRGDPVLISPDCRLEEGLEILEGALGDLQKRCEASIGGEPKAQKRMPLC